MAQLCRTPLLPSASESRASSAKAVGKPQPPGDSALDRESGKSSLLDVVAVVVMPIVATSRARVVSVPLLSNPAMTLPGNVLLYIFGAPHLLLFLTTSTALASFHSSCIFGPAASAALNWYVARKCNFGISRGIANHGFRFEMDSLRRVQRSETRNTTTLPAPTPNPNSVLGARTFDQYSAGQGHAIERPAVPAAVPSSLVSRIFKSIFITPVKISFALIRRAVQRPAHVPTSYISTEEQNKRRRCIVPGSFPETPAPSPARQIIASRVNSRRSPINARPTTLHAEQSPPQPTPDPMVLDTPPINLHPTNRFAVPDASMTDSTASLSPSPSLQGRVVRKPVSRLFPRRISSPPPTQQATATNRYAVPDESDDSDSDDCDEGDNGALAKQPQPAPPSHLSARPQGPDATLNAAKESTIHNPASASSIPAVTSKSDCVPSSQAPPHVIEPLPTSLARSEAARMRFIAAQEARAASNQSRPRARRMTTRRPTVDTAAPESRPSSKYSLAPAAGSSLNTKAGSSSVATTADPSLASDAGSSHAAHSGLSTAASAGYSLAAQTGSSRAGSSLARRTGLAGSSTAPSSTKTVQESEFNAAFIRNGTRRERVTRRTRATIPAPDPTPAVPAKAEMQEADAARSEAPNNVVEPASTQSLAAPVESEELSFLDDAPPPRPQKRVSFAGEKIYPDSTYVDWWDYHTLQKQGVYPTKTRHYRTEAAIDEVVPQWHTRQDTPPDTPDTSLVSNQSSVVPPTPQGTPRTPPAKEDGALKDLTNALRGALNFTVSRHRQGKRAETLSATKRREEEEERVAAAARQREAELAAAKAREEERRREEEKSIIKALDAQWHATLNGALAVADPAAEMTTTGISRRDLGTVTPVSSADGIGWLNDEVVNGYLTAMTAAKLGQLGFNRSTPDAVPGQHSFSTHLYTTYKARGWTGVSRWWTRARLGGQRMLRCPNILIPVNDRSHWTLVVINGAERTISYYDSMDNAGKEYTRFALDMVKNNLGPAFTEADWKIVATASQQQANALDCGVFVCMNALAVTKGRVPAEAFKTAQMKDARRQVAATLLNGGFSGDFSLE